MNNISQMIIILSSLVLALAYSTASAVALKKEKGINISKMNSTVRAADCINNSTHCHCAIHQAKENSSCYRLVEGETNRCYSSKCASGYHCDCESDDICQKLSTVSYQPASDTPPTTDTFECISNNVEVARAVVGHSSDFHVVAHQEFQLFINTEQVGYALGNVYKVFTVELKTGDIIGLIAKRQSNETYGVKLQFKDLNHEIRFIDSNWFASPVFTSNWLDPSFDPSTHPNWTAPSIVDSISSDAFSSDVPWVWLNDVETVYFRYELK